MISVADAVEMIALNRQEQQEAAKYEATIDAVIAQRFEGAPLTLEFKEPIAPKVAYAVQRRYEEPRQGGCWRVAVELQPNLSKFSIIPMLAAPLVKKVAQVALPPVAVQVASASAAAVPSGRRLLVRMPTRSRPAQALEVLGKYRGMAGAPVDIEVVLDEDDASMLAAPVLQRLCALGCVITVGRHRSKVEACNGGRFADWDVLLLASDDMVPVAENYAARALRAMEEHHPHLDGAVFFDDGFAGNRTCTLPVMGRRLYDQFGFVYNPAYKSLFCDNEQTEALRALGRLAYVDEKIVEHRHHVTGAERDALYLKNDVLWQVDEGTHKERKARNFDLPGMKLSVLICHLPARRPRLERLLDHVWNQVQHFPLRVEVLVDGGGGSVGEKRQRLLERARGEFVAYVDDDDWVAHDYVSRILAALDSDPGTDCVALSGVMTTAGEVPEVFENALRHREWHSKDGVHYRTPTHLSPVRRELALKVGFKAISHGEDHDYSARLYPLFKREVSTGSVPLYFYFYSPSKKSGEE